MASVEEASDTTTGDSVVVLGATNRTPRAVGRPCELCGDRRARFRRHGVVKADRTHTLCFECYRGERNRSRARRLADTFTVLPLPSPIPLKSSAVLDRAALYADLDVRRRRAVIALRHACEDEPVPAPLVRAS
jgi:hypothetical protein